MATSITLSNFKRTVFGNKRIVIADCTFGSTNYPAAGISLTPANLGLGTIEYLKAENGTLVYQYDYTNKALLAYTPAAATGADKVMIIADQADPDETVKVMAIGYGQG
jgi:hypothetical protein